MKEVSAVQDALFRYCFAIGYKHIMPNIYFDGFEADVFALTKSGYAFEFEIKMSRNDFKNDFNKKIKSWTGRGKDKILTINKHKEIQCGNRVSYFYFVCPQGLFHTDEIPEDYGLITFKLINGQIRLEIRWKAEKLSKNKFGSKKLLDMSSNFALRTWSKSISNNKQKC